MAQGAATIAAVSTGLVGTLRVEEWLNGVDNARIDRYVRRWAHTMLSALHVDVVTPPGDDRALPPGLVVANHRSFVDIPLLLARFGGQLLSRGDVAEWPVLGWLSSVGRTLYVDRSDRGSGAAAVRRIVSSLKAGGTVGVFAEGTTFLDDEVRPFLPGAFLAARQAKRPILPVGLAYGEPAAHFGSESFGEHAQNLFALGRVTVGVAIGDPIAATEKADVLAEKTRLAVQREVVRARALLQPLAPAGAA